MNVDYRIKENGKPKIHISRNESGTLGWLTENKFHYNKSNLIITESKINNPRPKDERHFILVVRLDGDNGKYKMSQISLNQNELSILRNNINKILNEDESKKKEMSYLE